MHASFPKFAKLDLENSSGAIGKQHRIDPNQMLGAPRPTARDVEPAWHAYCSTSAAPREDKQDEAETFLSLRDLGEIECEDL